MAVDEVEEREGDEESEDWMKQHDGEPMWDDASGKPLDPKLVGEAREEELREFRKLGVYIKVPVSRCWDATGKKPIGVRWVDINKGDDEKPEYRSRLVAKEMNREKRKISLRQLRR